MVPRRAAENAEAKAKRKSGCKDTKDIRGRNNMKVKDGGIPS
jgi:hypothetical protein